MDSMRIIPCPEVTVGEVEHILMLRLSAEFYVKTAHPQCVDVVAIRSSSAQDNRQGTYVLSTSSGMNAMNCHEVFRGPSVGIVPTVV
jgi:hypothetical protein